MISFDTLSSSRIEDLFEAKKIDAKNSTILIKNISFSIIICQSLIEIFISLFIEDNFLLLEEDVIEVEYSHELKIEVDFELFSIALKNLIDNAIKYKTEQNALILEQYLLQKSNLLEKLKNTFLFSYLLNMEYLVGNIESVKITDDPVEELSPYLNCADK